jgi:subtilisin-like proprotein convertase family protein
VVIAAHPNAQVRAIHTMIVGGEYANSTAGSVFGHNSATDAFAVGAVNVAEASGGEFPAGVTTPVELFSSDGPRRIFFDRSNQPIDPKNPGLTFASRGGVSRVKPDLSAADGVTTTLPALSGLNPFFGTSAAAPHAGAVAALIKSVMPSLTPAKIRTALQSGSIDVDELGTDRNSGRGVLSAFSALNKAGARPAVSLALGAMTITPIGGAVVAPGGAAQVSIQILNGGGASATAVSATLTSGSSSAVIQQGSVAYPTIPAGGSANSTTALQFSIDAAAPCGSTLPFTLTVNFSGSAGNHPSPAVFQFGVPIGQLGTTTTHFAYAGPPVAIPDNSPAGVDIPLTVSGFSGAIVKAVFNFDGTACSTTIGSTTVGLDHAFVNDLIATLTAPSGRTITLFTRPGGAGHNFCQTVFDDAAASSIQAAFPTLAPFAGPFKPAQPLAGFAGDTGSGTWILHVSDNAFFDTGTVRAFSLDLSGFSCTR